MLFRSTGDLGGEEDEARFAAENAMDAADEALNAAEGALAAAKDAMAAAHEPGHEPHNAASSHDVASEPAGSIATPTPGGIQIR